MGSSVKLLFQLTVLKMEFVPFDDTENLSEEPRCSRPYCGLAKVFRQADS
jgi:hypothetical protein